jgi:hypothetical protein
MVTWKSLAQPSRQQKAGCGLKLVREKLNTEDTEITGKKESEGAGNEG